MSDESSKTMMVDERQTVRQVLDSLLDKSHCGYSPDWSLVETINELQMGEQQLPGKTPDWATEIIGFFVFFLLFFLKVAL